VTRYYGLSDQDCTAGSDEVLTTEGSLEKESLRWCGDEPEDDVDTTLSFHIVAVADEKAQLPVVVDSLRTALCGC